MEVDSGAVSPEGVKPPVEIERKFLVASLPPNLDETPYTDIDQGYIAIAPNGTEVRVRRKTSPDGKVSYTQTVKMGKGLVRGEFETALTQEQFDTFYPSTEGSRIEKRRHRVPLTGGATAELDIYRGELNGLRTVEMEFDSEEASKQFAPPDWFGQDVTEDPSYKNQSLATKGMPQDDKPPVVNKW